MDPYKEKQRQRESTGYEIFEKYWGKSRGNKPKNGSFREAGIQNLLIQYMKN
jgi:hypothetical protein